MRRSLFCAAFVALVAIPSFIFSGSFVHAEVKLSSLFGDHMVVQRQVPIVYWGTADPGEEVTVDFDGISASTKAADDGTWRVELPAREAGGPFEVTIKGKNTINLKDVLVGEVWICSGQSNMAWTVDSSYDASLEKMAAKHPNIRIISVPQVGTQEPQSDFNGTWEACSPQTIGSFSAVGYYFGRQLQQSLDVPVGLIDNAWGGSACEAWVRRDLLEADEKYSDMLTRWDQMVANAPKAKAAHEKRVADWKEASKKAKADGKPAPRHPGGYRDQLAGNHRPSNIYNGVLKPTIGYPIRGTIWYQGESNASRAYQYRDLFPLMIQNWRDDWGIGDFSFYWVQLADFQAETDQPVESNWAELREAQTMTADKLPKTGEAVIIDIGEGRDIHPRNKQDVGMRLARLALKYDYGMNVVAHGPKYKSMEKKDGKILLTFDHTDGGLYTFDVKEPVGFAIAGEDKKFVWAQAKLVGKNQVEVWSDDVAAPVAVRYGWAQNPVCNLQNREGLPATPFRTDDWPGVTANAR